MSKTRKNIAPSSNGHSHRLEEYLAPAVNGNGKAKKSIDEEVLDLTLKCQPTGATPNQKKYLGTIDKNKITIVTGPAGSGKTHCAIGQAAKYLSEGRVDRIILVRPLIACDEELGFLPGDLNAKTDPFMRPLFDELSEFFTEQQIGKMVTGRRPIIEVVPLAVMKGRTLKRAFVILDEAQDATYKQIKMVLTRIGNTTKTVITGDITQTDREYYADEETPLEEVIRKLKGGQDIGFSQLTPADIQRDPMVELILERL
jgi:phosphate starvation-inducible PhoH-like protein